jgi:hypothetical protein
MSISKMSISKMSTSKMSISKMLTSKMSTVKMSTFKVKIPKCQHHYISKCSGRIRSADKLSNLARKFKCSNWQIVEDGAKIQMLKLANCRRWRLGFQSIWSEMYGRSRHPLITNRDEGRVRFRSIPGYRSFYARFDSFIILS